MSTRDTYDMIHHGMIEDCSVSTHDLFRETDLWSMSLGDLKGKETGRSSEEIKVAHVALGLRVVLVLNVDIMFVQSQLFSYV